VAGLSIHETFAGKHVFITGASGFVGKVWLAMLLQRVPTVAKVYVLLRGKGRGVKERFERIVTTSMVFKPLHEEHGPQMSEFVSRRVEVVAGDVSLPGLGIDPEVAARLHANVDVVLNCAGLVDFNPDLRDALASNVDGALHVADFTMACEHAALLHVSTCYVAGQRDGVIPEECRDGLTPNDEPIEAAAELEKAQKIIESVNLENESEKTTSTLREEVVARIRDRGLPENERRIDEMVGRLKRKRLREMMAKAGMDRAKELGWPNTYTYTKALAELVLRQRTGLRLAIFRPAIVESAIEFPFPGWNEGFNTSGPLVYLAGTWFRHVPARPGNPLDVIPVDQVCKMLFIVAAALMRDEHAPVYQCGSSDRNFLPIDRLTELSALGHRKHLRKTGQGPVERLLLSRWDAIAAEPEHVLNVGNVRRAVRQVTRYLRHGLPEKIPSEVRDWADDVARASETANRKLRQIEEILDLFLPFTYDHYCVFACRAIDRHQPVEAEFAFDPENIEWRSYWIDVHIPGLRRWCFPQYENVEREDYEPATPFVLLEDLEGEGAGTASTAARGTEVRQEVG
jgi:thioester reductase-like protein